MSFPPPIPAVAAPVPPPSAGRLLPSAGRLLRLWLGLGLQSFGGGLATLALIRRLAVEDEQWLTEAEFLRFWSLVQLAPGINLLALTILIGRKVAGVRGIFLALFGLLLPSAAITILLTAIYARVQHSALVGDALHGLIPATVGVGLVTAGQIARPLLQQSRRNGRGSLILSLVLLGGSALAAWLGHGPVLLILGAAGAVGAVWRWAQRPVRQEGGAG